jgi:hypothetical protein
MLQIENQTVPTTIIPKKEYTKGSVNKKGTIISPDEIDEELFRF